MGSSRRWRSRLAAELKQSELAARIHTKTARLDTFLTAYEKQGRVNDYFKRAEPYYRGSVVRKANPEMAGHVYDVNACRDLCLYSVLLLDESMIQEMLYFTTLART